MAYNKEATVIVVDVGSNMKEIVHEGKSALEVSLSCASRVLQNKLFTESKDEFSLVFFGTDETENRLNAVNEEKFQNLKTVSVDSPLRLADWELLSALSEIKTPAKQKGDVFDALNVAVDIIDSDNKASKKKRFAHRRIILMSNLKCYLNASKSQLKSLAEDFSKAGIDSLQIIGCDLEALPETDLSTKKLHAPKPAELINFLCDQLVEDAVISLKDSYSFSEAIHYTNTFAGRQVRPTPWKCLLEIGETVKIPIVGYARVKPAVPKQNWKKAFADDPSVEVERITSYYIQKDMNRTEVDKESIVDAYTFGASLVPFDEADKANMKYTNLGKRLQMLCFADKNQVGHNLYTGSDVKVLTAPVGDESAAMAVSAIVHALIKDNKVIVANYGYNAISAPKLVSLSPHICEKGNYEGFYMHYLPFEEDMRFLQFPSLDDPKLPQPDEEQLDAMADYIDKLTLNPDDEHYDEINPRIVRNPYLQKLYQSLEFRAMHPDDPLPDVDPALLQHLETPKDIKENAKAEVARLIGLFPTKMIERKNFGKKGAFAESQAPGTDGSQVADAISNLDIGGPKAPVVTEIGTVTPTENFTQMVENTDLSKFEEVVQKAFGVVDQLIFKTFNGSAYAGKVLTLLTAVREKCVERESVDIFNNFLTNFRDELITKRQLPVWEKLVQSKLTLISSTESKKSSVSAAQAKEFLEHVVINETKEEVREAPKDEDDAFAEMFA